MTAVVMSLTVPRPVRLTLADFVLLNDSGALEGYHRTELIDGIIYTTPAQYRRHAMVKGDVGIALSRKLEEIGSDYVSLIQGSVELSDYDLPEPDVVLSNEPHGDGYLPGRSVPLIVEVAETTQSIDLERKLAIYARAAVPEYWVLDTEAGIAHQHWAPEGTAYTQRREIALGQSITAETIPGLTVTLPE